VKNPQPSLNVSAGVVQSRRRRSGSYLALSVLLLAVLAIAASESPDADPDRSNHSAAAGAVRACDTETARSDLGSETRDSRVLLGLAAFTCQDYALAIELLSLTPDVTHPWEDWRLLVLAESAAELELPEPGTEAVDTLLDRYPDSPLRLLAYSLGVGLARDAGKPDQALSLVRAAREDLLPAELRSDLDLQAWEIANGLESAEALRDSARQLLLHSPADAVDLDAEDVLRSSDGSILWTDLFAPSEILVRITNLLTADMAEAALEMLAIVPEGQRDIDWHLLHGRALIGARRGTEALDALVDVTAPDRESGLALEWLRAEAALDAATARRGRHNLPAAEREQMRLLAHGHLWQVVR